MTDRHLVQIPPEQVKKLQELDNIRADLAGYPISKKVHILLQEKLAQMFQSKSWFPHKDGTDKGRWFEYIRETIPVHIAAPIAIGSVRDTEETIGMSFTKMLVTNHGNKTWWGNYKQDIYDMGDYLIPKLKKKSSGAKYYSDYKKLYQEMKELCAEMRNKDYSKLTKQELYEKYERFYEKLKRYLGLSMDIDAIDPALESKMKEKLRELMTKKEGASGLNEKTFNSVYNAITTPAELSYLNKEQYLLYQLAKKIKSKKNLFELFSYDDLNMITNKIWQDAPDIKHEMLNIMDEYWWTSIGWSIWNEKDVNVYIMDLKKIFRDNPNVEGEIERLDAFRKKAALERANATKIYDFDEDMNSLMDIFDHYIEIHDWRKEVQMKGLVAMKGLLLEVSKRHSIKVDYLLWCWPWEIMELIKTVKLDINKILPRKAAFFYIVTKDGIEQHSGEMAIKRRKEEFAADVMDIHNFNGVIASLGKSVGKVKVCYSSAEAIKKIEQGDILVCGMTMPDYLPAMKKSAAIVTDEGGVTSHAAIVSRELKIPCIVGTKVATRVLNDNDKVEVNANHGVVKILERAK